MYNWMCKIRSFSVSSLNLSAPIKGLVMSFLDFTRAQMPCVCVVAEVGFIQLVYVSLTVLIEMFVWLARIKFGIIPLCFISYYIPSTWTQPLKCSGLLRILIPTRCLRSNAIFRRREKWWFDLVFFAGPNRLWLWCYGSHLETYSANWRHQVAAQGSAERPDHHHLRPEDIQIKSAKSSSPTWRTPTTTKRWITWTRPPTTPTTWTWRTKISDLKLNDSQPMNFLFVLL